MREFKNKKKAATAFRNENNGDFFGVQAKLNISQPGDKYEKEADRVADKVVNKTAGQPDIQKMEGQEEELQQKPLAESISTVQKKELKELNEEEKPVQKQESKEEEKEVQAKCAECEKEEQVQKKGETEEEKPVQKQEKEEEKPVQTKKADMHPGTEKEATEPLEGKLSDSGGTGNQMDADIKQEMEAGFGADFSNVNIHNDSKAEQMNQQLGAQAFTHGNDIYFNKGRYNPGSKEGKHLLAHELTHTIQQTGLARTKVQKQGSSCADTVPYGGTFGNLLKVPFYSTADCPNIEVIINHRAIVSGFQSCASFDISIDGVQRTRRTVQTSDTESTTVFNFTMQNAVKHHLIFYMPSDCQGLQIRVRGNIRRH